MGEGEEEDEGLLNSTMADGSSDFSSLAASKNEQSIGVPAKPTLADKAHAPVEGIAED